MICIIQVEIKVLNPTDFTWEELRICLILQFKSMGEKVLCFGYLTQRHANSTFIMIQSFSWSVSNMHMKLHKNQAAHLIHCEKSTTEYARLSYWHLILQWTIPGKHGRPAECSMVITVFTSLGSMNGAPSNWKANSRHTQTLSKMWIIMEMCISFYLLAFFIVLVWSLEEKQKNNYSVYW